MKYCWTTINVSSIEKSLLFYRDIIGLEVKKQFKPNEEMEIAFLGNGETQVELICNKNNKDILYGKDISLGFITESINRLTDFLKSKNIDLHSGPFQPNPQIKFIYIQDPDGLKIQFVENIS